jgi:DHA1 family inner membrane transport protein
LSGCARDLSMGLASSIGGWIVVKEPSGHLDNFYWLGWLAVATGILSIWLASRVRVNDVRASAAPISSAEAVEAAVVEM